MKRLLILGGTIEGRQLAEALAADARFHVTVSLAGRTDAPTALPASVRTGGFGGAEGLARYLDEQAIDILVDATHPFAATMKRNAAAAAVACAIPLLAVDRPAWQAEASDRWTSVPDIAGALDVIGAEPRCVFVTVGRRELAGLERAPRHIYLIRSVGPPDPPPALPGAHYLAARGPFYFADEIALMRDYGVEWLIAKNSGGDATYAKIEAARKLSLPVAMIARPAVARENGSIVPTVAEALQWLAAKA